MVLYIIIYVDIYRYLHGYRSYYIYLSICLFIYLWNYLFMYLLTSFYWQWLCYKMMIWYLKIYRMVIIYTMIWWVYMNCNSIHLYIISWYIIVFYLISCIISIDSTTAIKDYVTYSYSYLCMYLFNSTDFFLSKYLFQSKIQDCWRNALGKNLLSIPTCESVGHSNSNRVLIWCTQPSLKIMGMLPKNKGAPSGNLA